LKLLFILICEYCCIIPCRWRRRSYWKMPYKDMF